MFSILIPIKEITPLVSNNIRILSADQQIDQILLVNIGSTIIELQTNTKKVEILQLFDINVYDALDKVIDRFVTQDNVVILDNNIQVGTKFIPKLVTHFADNHLYTFKVNNIFPNKSVTIDSRIGNRIKPSMFSILAVAFKKTDAEKIDLFDKDNLAGFANRMLKSGVKLQLLNQVLCHQMMGEKSYISKELSRKANSGPVITPFQRPVSDTFIKVDTPEYNKNLTYDIIIPFGHNKDRLKAFEKTIDVLYKNTKYIKNIRICVHETSDKRYITEEFIKKYNIFYIFTEYDGIFDIAWNYNYFCKNHLSGDIFVFFDADLIIDWRWIKHLLYIDRDKSYVGWKKIRYISETGSDQYNAGVLINECSYKRTLKYSKGVTPGGINIIPRTMFFDVKGWPEDYSGLGYGCVDCSMIWKLILLYDVENFNCVIYHLPHEINKIRNDIRMTTKETHRNYTKEDWLTYIDDISSWGEDVPRSRMHE